jgi:hypothetical protein
MSDPSTNHQRFVQAVTAVSNEINASQLHSLLSRIALARYEGSPNTGYLALCPAEGAFISPDVALEVPMPVYNVRGVRKMLHITLPKLAGLCDGRVVYGFGDVSTNQANLLIVKFQWPGSWRLMRGGAIIAQTNARHEENGETIGLREELFCGTVQQLFGPLTAAKSKHLWNLIQPASRQPRGTNVLISADAAAEAARLNSQCTKVKPFALTPAVMEQITSLDGSVVIDLDGVCHAMGAILDGSVSARGNRVRGGRYNSALMYVDSCPFPSLIVVVSQDGMINLVYRESLQVRS